jgi:hypothetical protein
MIDLNMHERAHNVGGSMSFVNVDARGKLALLKVRAKRAVVMEEDGDLSGDNGGAVLAAQQEGDLVCF